MDVNNIEQYVSKLIVIELRKQNEKMREMEKELENLRLLASRIDYCSECFTPESQAIHYSGVKSFYCCYICEKVVCDNDSCCKHWLLEDEGYEADYCSFDCYNEDNQK